jgi:DNA-binding CsgD family transcriptional regulator
VATSARLDDPVPDLLERGDDLAALVARLAQARNGSGGVVLVRGAAGIGKTRLVSALRGWAREEGVVSLQARAGRLEQDFPFGCVRQLLEPVLRPGAPGREELLAGDARLAEPAFGVPGTADAAADAGFGTLHGLYWLTVNLAERGPLLLTVDDAHWADAASLRFIAYLARRLEGVPALVVLTVRSSEASADGTLAAIAAEPTTQTLDPAPLSEGAVATLLGAALGADAEPALVRACHGATGGNPFLVRELIEEVRRGASAVDPSAIDALGPDGVAAAVESRLDAIGAGALPLARAVAVLGDGATLARTAALASLPPDEAGRLSDALVGAGVLRTGRPLDFVHPIVGNAVASRMGPAERERWHRRAAEQLAAEGASPDLVALHLLATEPAGRDEVVDGLLAAGLSARGRGAPEAAVRFLERALAEPPGPGARATVLSELGRAAAALGDPRAHDWLRAAVEADGDAEHRMEAARSLAMALVYAGGADEVLAVCERVGAAVSGGGELGRRLDRWLVGVAAVSPATRAAAGAGAARNLAAARAGDRLAPGLLASAALEVVLTGGTAEESAGLARRAVADGLLDESDPDSVEPASAFVALVLAERHDELETLIRRIQEIVRSEGDTRAYAATLAFRAWGRHRAGRLADVQADIDLHPVLPVPGVADLLLAAVHVQVLVDTGRLDEAAAVATMIEGLALDPELTIVQRMTEAVAALRLAQGEPRRALEATGRAAAWEAAMGVAGGGLWSPWRLQAAEAHIALGEPERAVRLAEDQLTQARAFGASAAVGAAQRVLGLARGGGNGIATLEEAVATLGASGSPLEHARALVDLGVRRRRAGRPGDARAPLADGLSLARRCGAAALEERALDELVAAGARPRQRPRNDLESLTPSELRVAQMAARGLSNKQIAQSLYVTVKTVETHLWRTYGKLDISSRAQLSSRIAADPAEPVTDATAPTGSAPADG